MNPQKYLVLNRDFTWDGGNPVPTRRVVLTPRGSEGEFRGVGSCVTLVSDGRGTVRF